MTSTSRPRKTMQEHLLGALPDQRPLLLSALLPRRPLTIAVLAPHPDDFDAIAVSLRHLHAQGHDIHVAVLTSGANGVDDGWNGALLPADKATLREVEQRESCRYFGLPADRLVFMRLWEQGTEQPQDEAAYEALRAYLHGTRPDLVFLPHGNDSNRTHQRTYQTCRSVAVGEGLRIQACLNLDAKTLSMRPDVYMYFGEGEAAWKAQMLRLHRSQQERNLRTRGQGLDERVLAVNRRAAMQAGGPLPYAEVFELQCLG